MAQYWVAGANVDDENMVDDFIEHGFWFADAERSQPLIKQIAVGDRIAIKRMLGYGATELRFTLLGLSRKSHITGQWSSE